MTIQISAIICTLNRASYLSKAIRSLLNQTLDKDHYEILIIDNGSTDDTKSIVQNEFCEIKNIRYVYEPVLGLSQARNTGWRNAIGEYIAYLDDDAIASTLWLETILHTFETIEPKPAGVGGKIEPLWEKPKPSWLSEKIIGCLGVVDWSDEPGPLAKNQWIGGGNSAYQKCIIENAGGFSTDLGRIGNKLLSNEETLLHNKIEQKGLKIFYHPNMAIKHVVHSSRLKKTWFLNRYFWQGVSQAMTEIHLHDIKKSALSGLAFRSATSLLRTPSKLFRLLFPESDPDKFAENCITISQLGYIYGLLKCRFQF